MLGRCLSLLTVMGAASPALAIPPYGGEGCWVSVFDGTLYRPPTARIEGPTFLENPEADPVLEPDLRRLGGQDFVNRIDSFIAGPRAKVEVFEETNFTGRERTFGPGARVPDLSVFGFANRIGSIRISCER